MPWSPSDAARHNRKAKGKSAAQWSAVANSVLAKTGNDARAIRAANSVIARRSHGLDSVKNYADGGKVTRKILTNDDPARKQESKIPNAYRGKLQNSMEQGDSLPEVYDAKKPIRT